MYRLYKLILHLFKKGNIKKNTKLISLVIFFIIIDEVQITLITMIIYKSFIIKFKSF